MAGRIAYLGNIVTQGLVLDLDAAIQGSYPKTGSLWTDISGNNNNGTLVNGPAYTGSDYGAIVFDGTNDYLTTPLTTTSGQALTIIGTLYSTETTATYRNFYDSATQKPMIWWDATGKVEFDITFTSSVTYRNQWTFVALSKPTGNSSPSYYINGTFVGTGSAYTVPSLTPTWFNRATNEEWLGNAQVVQFYNRALSATEITQNFNALRGRYGI